MSTAFADDFRCEIEDEYGHILNVRSDSLAVARAGGLSALAGWIRDEAFPELCDALDNGEPTAIDNACARIALAALFLRDASRAFSKTLELAYAGPEAEREQRIRAAVKLTYTGQRTGAQRIAFERDRHQDDEGYATTRTSAELADAALVYLAAAINDGAESAPPAGWPWDAKLWKPASPIRMLEKAGALIAAEIDRRVRAGEKI